MRRPSVGRIDAAGVGVDPGELGVQRADPDLGEPGLPLAPAPRGSVAGNDHSSSSDWM